MIKLLQYQSFCAIPSGSTVQEYNIKIFELMKWDYTNLTDDQVNNKVKKFISSIVENINPVDHIKLGKKWYKIDKDLHTLKFPQWLYFDGVMKSVEKELVYEKLQFVLASFARPCRFYKWFPKKFSYDTVKDVAKHIQWDLDIDLALQLTNFFFHYTTNFMSNTRIEYLERLEKEIWEPTEPKHSRKHTAGT